eukprot:s82_g2.t1
MPSYQLGASLRPRKLQTAVSVRIYMPHGFALSRRETHHLSATRSSAVSLELQCAQGAPQLSQPNILQEGSTAELGSFLYIGDSIGLPNRGDAKSDPSGSALEGLAEV